MVLVSRQVRQALDHEAELTHGERRLERVVARYLRIGEWFNYRNNYDQQFNALLVRRIGLADGRLYLIVKRPEWPREECLAVSDFNNGTYTIE